MTKEINHIIAGLFEPYDYEDLTVDNTSGGVSLDSSKVKNNTNRARECQRVIMTLETASIRYTPRS